MTTLGEYHERNRRLAAENAAADRPFYGTGRIFRDVAACPRCGRDHQEMEFKQGIARCVRTGENVRIEEV